MHYGHQFQIEYYHGTFDSTKANALPSITLRASSHPVAGDWDVSSPSHGTTPPPEQARSTPSDGLCKPPEDPPKAAIPSPATAAIASAGKLSPPTSFSCHIDGTPKSNPILSVGSRKLLSLLGLGATTTPTTATYAGHLNPTSCKLTTSPPHRKAATSTQKGKPLSACKGPQLSNPTISDGSLNLSPRGGGGKNSAIKNISTLK